MLLFRMATKNALLATLGLLALTPPPALAVADPPAASALQEAEDLMDERKLKEAVRAFKQADKQAGGSCFDCQLGLARAFNELGAHKEALKSTEAAVRLTTDEGKLVSVYSEQGFALFVLAGNDPEMLERAEKAFRFVLDKTGGKSNVTRYNLAGTYLRRGRDAEGIALLKEYLEREPEGHFAASARELIANPVRARKRLVPTFELVTLSGDFVTSEELAGKVVLLDFWATWCAPCVMAIPDLKMLARRRAKDPFVLLSISVDSDEAALRAFLKEHEATWPQVWDQRSELTRKCKVESFPTYLLVDHTGEIVYSTSGWGPSIASTLDSKVLAAVRAARKAAKPAGTNP